MRPPTAELLNHLTPHMLGALKAALVQGSCTLALVGLFWLAFRKHLSDALAHGLFFLVPVKTAAALFVAWPVPIAFSIPVSESIFSAVYPIAPKRS